MYIFYQIWKIFWLLFRYIFCPFLFSPSETLHYTDVDTFDNVLQISDTVFLHSFFFLFFRLDHFSLSVLKLTDSSSCLNLLKTSSEFFISFTVALEFVWFLFIISLLFLYWYFPLIHTLFSWFPLLLWVYICQLSKSICASSGTVSVNFICDWSICSRFINFCYKLNSLNIIMW